MHKLLYSIVLTALMLSSGVAVFGGKLQGYDVVGTVQSWGQDRVVLKSHGHLISVPRSSLPAKANLFEGAKVRVHLNSMDDALVVKRDSTKAPTTPQKTP